MKIALIDDEYEYRAQMLRLCREFSASRGEFLEPEAFPDGGSFLGGFRKGDWPLVFLDVYMPGTGGLELAEEIRRVDRDCLLVFLTSSQDHMPEAFSFHAFEYVTKPISPQRVFRVLEDALRTLPRSLRSVQVPTGRTTRRIALESIVSVTSDAHYLDITLTDGQPLRCRMTLQAFLDLAGNDPRFILVNKGIMVNARYVAGFDGGACTLTNGQRFPVRVRDRQSIEQQVLDYHFHALRNDHGLGGEGL